MYEMAVLKGPSYLPSQHGGDGLGMPYQNWDLDSVTECDCDAAFFGADCSLSENFIKCS